MNKIEPFLSICITSYNRVNELKRCLESVDSEHSERIEIVVSEDCSPRKSEISEVVERFKANSEYNVLYNSNEVNLGYDRNLGKLIALAKGKYILFMSDDDAFISKSIDKIMDKLFTLECPMAFAPFYSYTVQKHERKYKRGFNIEPGIENVKKYIYSSILFSGLIFERNKVLIYDSEPFHNLMYFQVYLFFSVLHKHGGTYLDIPLINCINDGENAFGISESSIKNTLLADRKSIFSNLEYHKGLIQVINIFDEDNGTDVIQAFEKEYSLRTYAGLSTARKAGKKEFKIYWHELNALDIQLTMTVKMYYWSLKVFGSNICDVAYDIPKKLLLKLRHNHAAV